MTKTKTKKKQELSFRLIGLELLGTNFEIPQQQLPNKITFHFDIEMEYRINPEAKTVFVVTWIYISDEKNKETRLGSVTTGCNFHVENLGDFTNKKTKKVEFPKEVLHTFSAIAYSTTRGVMFSELRGTFLHSAYLPLVDPAGFNATN